MVLPRDEQEASRSAHEPSPYVHDIAANLRPTVLILLKNVHQNISQLDAATTSQNAPNSSAAEVKGVGHKRIGLKPSHHLHMVQDGTSVFAL